MVKVQKPVEPDIRLGLSHTKPAFDVDDLVELRGPMSRVTTLPIHIDWTSQSTYDLSKPQRVRTIYATVLREAGSEDQVVEWIDRDLLVEHWDELNLPGFVREAREVAHDELRRHRED